MMPAEARSAYSFPSADRFPPRAARAHALLTAITMDYIDWLHNRVAGRAPIVVKGVMRADDALRLADHGVAGDRE